MRYLREETERISLLAPVRLSPDKATALLERSRVLVSVNSPGVLVPGDSPEETVSEPVLAAPDPFGALGIGAAILDLPAAPEPTASPAPFEQVEEAPEDPAAEESEESEPELEHGSTFEAEEADRSTPDALAAVPEELWLADTPEEASVESSGDGPDTADEESTPSLRAEDADVSSAAATLIDTPPAEPSPTPDEGSVKDRRPSTMVVPGWEPATELKMPWGDIPAAAPAPDTWAPDVAAIAGLPVSRGTPLPPPAPFPA
ncbi:MAG: hypothetical protein WA751_08955, partial [Candidatus Dormiibacterota bacterium]